MASIRQVVWFALTTGALANAHVILPSLRNPTRPKPVHGPSTRLLTRDLVRSGRIAFL